MIERPPRLGSETLEVDVRVEKIGTPTTVSS
jgi:hypothetical protein